MPGSAIIGVRRIPDVTRHYSSYIAAGSLPFIGAAIAAAIGLDRFGPVSSITDAVVAYGLAIASFVAGTHWAVYLQYKASAPANLFVSSNVTVLAPWLAFVSASTRATIVVLVLTFLYLVFVDWRLRKSNLIESAYFRQRLAVTAVVCISLLTVLATS